MTKEFNLSEKIVTEDELGNPTWVRTKDVKEFIKKSVHLMCQFYNKHLGTTLDINIYQKELKEEFEELAGDTLNGHK